MREKLFRESHESSWTERRGTIQYSTKWLKEVLVSLCKIFHVCEFMSNDKLVKSYVVMDLWKAKML